MSINCLAYYGITVGKTERTFAPNDHVTRSQMALILTRAAAVADIDLGLAADAGFTDIDMVSVERRNPVPVPSPWWGGPCGFAVSPVW